MSSGSESEEEKIVDLRDPIVVEKYRTAAGIVNKALTGVLAKIVVGESITNLCQIGDLLINEQCSTIYKNKKILKGVAFPTNISANNCVGHYSPYASESDVVNDGDILKIDMGCHIDGFIATVAHTVVVGDKEISGKVANCIEAAHTALEVARRVIKPGVKNSEVTEAIGKVVDQFGVSTVQGVLTHQMKQWIIDGNKVIIEREEIEQKVDDCEIDLYEVYGLDIVVSTGEGKPRETGPRTTIYKRAVDQRYNLRMKASRALLKEVDSNYPTLPFNIRNFPDANVARLGVTECLKHDLLHPYPVLYEKDGEIVAHFKTTLLLLNAGTESVTGYPYDSSKIKCDVEVDEETKKILAVEYYLLYFLDHILKRRKQKKLQQKKVHKHMVFFIFITISI